MNISLNHKFILTIVALIVVLAGCDNRFSPPPNIEHPILRIGYTSEEHFSQRYGNIVHQQFPDYRIEIVPLREMIKSRTSVNEWLKTNPVDLMYVNSSQFQELIDHNGLVDLGISLKETPSLEESILPPLLELTKLYGQGTVYGLPSNFYSQAIVFNQDLFDRSLVPYPTDGMSWEELLASVSRLNGGLSIHAASPFHLLDLLGQASRLQMVDSATQEVTMNTPAWSRIWSLTTAAVKNGSLHMDDINENPFLTGDRAAAWISYEEFKALEQAAPSFRWSMATVPADSSLRGTTTSIVAEGFWTIPAVSSNPDDAWNLISFFMSDKAAKWGYRSDYGFSTLTEQFSLNSKHEESIGAFYRARPQIPMVSSWPEYLPDLVNGLFEEIVSDSVSIDEGLQQLQEQAEQMAAGKP